MSNVAPGRFPGLDAVQPTGYDVFLSHNRVDKPWVRSFAIFLRSQGLNVFFDEDSIPFGADIVQSIEDGVQNSRHILLVITPASVKSKWVALESSLGIYSDPDARQRTILPLLLENTPREAIRPAVRRLNTADLTTHISGEIALRKLLSQLGVVDVEGITLTPFLPASATATASSTKPRDIFSFREPARDWYVARKEQEFIRSTLFVEETGGRNLVLTGRTGVGKSSVLNWLAMTSEKANCPVIKFTPFSDRITDLLVGLTHSGVEILNAIEVQAPSLRGIPKLDCQAVFDRIATKSTKQILILVDQVERLFPPGLMSAAGITAIWNALMDALGSLKTHGRLRWVFAVKEWYFLLLFPTEMQLRVNNFTYLTLADLDHDAALALLRRMADLAEVVLRDDCADLIVTKTGGRPIALVLTFILSVDRSPIHGQVDYEYLSATEPWNDIFDADFCGLDSERQRQIVLAMAHAGREVVSEEEVIRKIVAVRDCSREEIMGEIRRLDHDWGLIQRNEGLLTFVHSGFGVFVHGKYANDYPKQWNDTSTASRFDETFVDANAVRQTIAVLAHRLGNILPVSEMLTQRLRKAIQGRDWSKALELTEELDKASRRAFSTVRDFRSFYSRPRWDPNARTSLTEAAQTAADRISQMYPNMRISVHANYEPALVAGESSAIIDVFTELLQNSAAHGREERTTVNVDIDRDGSTQSIRCDVADTGPGIPAEFKKRIFEPFFATSAGGSGLGLAIVRSTMQAFGGSIEEIGEPGRGSRFRLYFKSFSESMHEPST